MGSYLSEFNTREGLAYEAGEKAEDFLRRAIWYISRTGCQWRFVPTYYGHWGGLHKRFLRWAKKEIWERLFENLKIDPDLETVMIDASIIRAHACAAGYEKNSQQDQALGRCVGGFSSKVNAMVDALGNPLKFILSPGSQHETKIAPALNRRDRKFKFVGRQSF